MLCDLDLNLDLDLVYHEMGLCVGFWSTQGAMVTPDWRWGWWLDLPVGDQAFLRRKRSMHEDDRSCRDRFLY